MDISSKHLYNPPGSKDSRKTCPKADYIIELTVPWETRCEEAYGRKKAKSRRKRLLFSVSVQTDDSTWGYWQRQKRGYPETELSN
ncbi:hypothetical protein DPMN_011548 [Dreissena polymorpha]|uniref:Uncharacterized protein n=1 Tax=Dreissena polymorpha TaxID=45954 RepID=A0A9D4N480_DREPO|nr:hypothetical protein DPMN_011548 [Dreissena polymorpha]